MPRQTFTEQDLQAVMDDPSVTILSGWTEPNMDTQFDEEAYRQKLEKNHAGYSAKIKEAIESVTHGATTGK